MTSITKVTVVIITKISYNNRKKANNNNNSDNNTATQVTINTEAISNRKHQL